MFPAAPGFNRQLLLPMKTIPCLPILFLALAVTAVAQPCSGRGAARGGTAPCATASTAPLQLSAAASEALLFQIEEERMAREIYATLEQKWGLRPFRRIQRAEAHHEAVLRALATRGALTVPAALAGKFASPIVQQRYDELVARGLRSADEALAAAAVVEQQDIADLKTLIASTDSAELKAVAMALEAASERHLAAFSGRPAGGGAGRGAGAGWRAGR